MGFSDVELCGCVGNADVGVSSASCCRCRACPAAGREAEIPAEELSGTAPSACPGEQHLWRVKVDLV